VPACPARRESASTAGVDHVHFIHQRLTGSPDTMGNDLGHLFLSFTGFGGWRSLVDYSEIVFSMSAATYCQIAWPRYPAVAGGVGGATGGRRRRSPGNSCEVHHLPDELLMVAVDRPDDLVLQSGSRRGQMKSSSATPVHLGGRPAEESGPARHLLPGSVEVPQSDVLDMVKLGNDSHPSTSV